MEGLKLDNNVLLRDHFRNEFKAPSLLISPLPETIGSKNSPDIWWNFLSPRSEPCGIEQLPIEKMKRHSFALEEAFDEIDLKIAGTEVRGIVGIFGSFKRWYFKGFPALQAFAGETGSEDHASATIRLTCIFKSNWIDRQLLRSQPNSQVVSQSHYRQKDTISVFASTELQRYADPIGLAAHRAAFKLFYRLASRETHPDQVNAVAAFHQGAALLLILI
jgi:hypothetical protein